MSEQQTFYVVATPIGNLEDMTLRAVRILGEVDCVLCEDTRETRKLLQKFDIKTPTLSFHSQSSEGKFDQVFALLEEGQSLALVTDAGTPGISDPGSELVARTRERFPKLPIVTIPGASALTAALSIAGLPSSDFLFLGFLPHKKGRETLFKEMAASDRTVAFYESPHRLLKTLESLVKFIEPTRRVIVTRELTKIYEELVQGSPADVLEFFTKNEGKVRGEFVLVVSGLSFHSPIK
jgi:16S rRNA (cytidine1402-2'-O)-methyltransferase